MSSAVVIIISSSPPFLGVCREDPDKVSEGPVVLLKCIFHRIRCHKESTRTTVNYFFVLRFISTKEKIGQSVTFSTGETMEYHVIVPQVQF